MSLNQKIGWSITTWFVVMFVLIFFLTSCGAKIPASMNYGTVMDVYKGNYGNVVLKADSGKADYNTWVNVYFPMKVNKKDDIVIVPQRYLDSLINQTVIKTISED